MAIKNGDMPAMPITLKDGEIWSEDFDYAIGLTKREMMATTSRLWVNSWIRAGLPIPAQLCALCWEYKMITLGVWIFAAACWHSDNINAYGMFWSLLAAILVSVFVK